MHAKITAMFSTKHAVVLLIALPFTAAGCQSSAKHGKEPLVFFPSPPAEPLRTLWYRQPAREWNEALPLGNGRLGAMVFGGVEKERLQFNDDTLASSAAGAAAICSSGSKMCY